MRTNINQSDLGQLHAYFYNFFYVQIEAVIWRSVQWITEETFDPSLYLIFANLEKDKSLTLLEDVVEFASQYWQNLKYNVR